jgi:hypothetical protein
MDDAAPFAQTQRALLHKPDQAQAKLEAAHP